jgi:hypothetical protein
MANNIYNAQYDYNNDNLVNEVDIKMFRDRFLNNPTLLPPNVINNGRPTSLAAPMNLVPLITSLDQFNEQACDILNPSCYLALTSNSLQNGASVSTANYARIAQWGLDESKLSPSSSMEFTPNNY